MAFNKTTQALNSLKQKEPVQAPNFELPNNSGDHQRSIKRNTPTGDKDLVNKEYVDAAVQGGLALFQTENAVADIAGYMQIVPTPTGAAEENTITAVAGETGTLMEEYATILNSPCVSSLAFIPEGIVTLHLHAKGEAANKMSFYFEFYKRNSLGVETLITTSEDSNLLSTTSASYVIHGTITEEVTWTSTDRVVIKIYGKNRLVAAKDLTIYVEGDTASRFELSGTVPVGNNVTASAVLTDEVLTMGDGGSRGIQETIYNVTALLNHPHQDVNTSASPTFQDVTLDGENARLIFDDGSIGNLATGDGGMTLADGTNKKINYADLSFSPSNTNQLGLGTSSKRWKDIYSIAGDYSGNITTIAPTTDLHCATKKYVDDNLPDQANANPQRATIWADELIVTSGNARITVLNTGQLYNFFNWLPLADANDGDAFSSSFFLKAGTYDFYALGLTGSQRGIIDWAVDGTAIVTGQDWYNGSTVFNAVKTASGITIATDGYHKLTGTINGKHASSSDYTMPLTKLWFKPTTDPSRS